jgi:hypothetical protein
VHLAEPRLEECEVVVELVPVRGFGEQARGVRAAAEADPRGIRIAKRLEGAPPLLLTGVERRVGVDELERAVREARECIEAVTEDDLVARRTDAKSL